MVKAITTTDEHAVKVSNKAWQLHTEIVAARQHMEDMRLYIASKLYVFQRDKHYISLGYRSFTQWCADPIVDITYRTAMRLIRDHKLYVVKLLGGKKKRLKLHLRDEGYEDEWIESQVQELEKSYMGSLSKAGTTKLDMVASRVHGKNVDEFLNSAATLSKTDLQARLDGVEPVYTPVAWRDLLHETRAMALLLVDRHEVPQEVREFSLDYWVNTEAWD